MSNPSEIKVQAEVLISEAESLFAEKSYKEAGKHYHLCSKTAEVLGDYVLAAYAVIKELESQFLRKEFIMVDLLLSRVVTMIDRAHDPKLITEFERVLNQFSWALPLNKQSKEVLKNHLGIEIIPLKFDSRSININIDGQSTLLAVEIFEVPDILAEYKLIETFKCSSCGEQMGFRMNKQVLLFGTLENTPCAMDLLQTKCLACQQPTDFYFDINSFFWDEKAPEDAEKDKKFITDNTKGENGKFFPVDEFVPENGRIIQER